MGREKSPAEVLSERWRTVCVRYHASGLRDLSLHDRHFFLIYDMLGQVGNGGIEGYFDNSTGHLAPETVDALDALGSTKSAAALRSALAHFPGNAPPSDWEARRAAIDELDDSVIDEWRQLHSAIFEEEAQTHVHLSQLPV